MRIVFALCGLSLCALIAGCTKDSASSENAGGPAAVVAEPDESCGGCDMSAGTTEASAKEGEACGGCDKSEDASKVAAMPEEGCGGCAESGAMAMTEHDPAKLTKGIQLDEFTPISQILAAPADFEGQRVLVKGMAVGVCEKRGCWITLKSEADNDKALKVKVEDGEIVFPLTLKGQEVVVEGIIEKIVTPGAAKGEVPDPESVTAPKITWQLKGLGARWES